MDKIVTDVKDSFRKLMDELSNFQDIARYIKPEPGDIPELRGFEIYGETIALNGIISGDHIIYVDFKKRFDLEARIREAQERNREEVVENLRQCQKKAGIVLLDTSGHQITDALMGAMLHQAFLLGAIYELDYFGEITTRLFEHLNTRFFKSSGLSKFLTMIYGEISEGGTFRFVSAGHPMPVLFSNRDDGLVDISRDTLAGFPPIGTLPSQEDIDRSVSHSVLGHKEKYEVNEISLMEPGDILLLYTDGLSEHIQDSDVAYFPDHLEISIRKARGGTANEIFHAIREEVLGYNQPADDISFVIIKRT